MSGYSFHCSSCGFAHAGECVKEIPPGVPDVEEMLEAVKEASLDELKAAYVAIKEELFRRMS